MQRFFHISIGKDLASVVPDIKKLSLFSFGESESAKYGLSVLNDSADASYEIIFLIVFSLSIVKSLSS